MNLIEGIDCNISMKIDVMNFINNNRSGDTPHTNVNIGTRSRQKGIQPNTANSEKRKAMLLVHPLDVAVAGNNHIFCLNI